MKPRTRARSVALQALYEIDITQHPFGTVISERISENEMSSELAEFAQQIVIGIVPLIHNLDLHRSICA
jgi:N utilization substance protein B